MSLDSILSQISHLEDEEESAVKLDPVISFKLGEQLFAVGIEDVREVIKCPEITRIALVPKHILGLVNVRGNVYVVGDFAHWLDLGKVDSSSIFLIIVEAENVSVALAVSQVPNTIHVDLSAIQNAGGLITGKNEVQKYFSGVLNHEKELITFLDIQGLVCNESFAIG
ncbi:MAG: purine-binding chemotaxis protein CheW [Cyclobacteriaceae bacterium]|jgi:purine-binding chemotaxis protein CheW